MKNGDIVNIKKQHGGFWKGKVVKILDKWEHKLNNGKVLTVPYTQPIMSVKEINGIGSATLMESNLEFRDGEYWEK
jgi:hypothetical protein